MRRFLTILIACLAAIALCVSCGFWSQDLVCPPGSPPSCHEMPPLPNDPPHGFVDAAADVGAE